VAFVVLCASRPFIPGNVDVPIRATDTENSSAGPTLYLASAPAIMRNSAPTCIAERAQQMPVGRIHPRVCPAVSLSAVSTVMAVMFSEAHAEGSGYAEGEAHGGRGASMSMY
jgi:hypothetical protein